MSAMILALQRFRCGSLPMGNCPPSQDYQYRHPLALQAAAACLFSTDLRLHPVGKSLSKGAFLLLFKGLAAIYRFVGKAGKSRKGYLWFQLSQNRLKPQDF
ncbi:hypothetical protein [Kistimonas asteriae]|uniref:hypothetical protein n=1 Tax=Kistimonas asteriae TaxID=517724 RepID=UPI001BA50C1F|nr:hypothetical protein [Kistimonas asteriae]